MNNKQVLLKTHSILILIVLFLSFVALTAELLPEVKAKMIVIPTLILMIILVSLKLENALLLKIR